jgi:hypothetical protein
MNNVKLTGRLIEDLTLGSFIIPEFIIAVDKKLPENKRIYRKRKRQLVNYVKVTLFPEDPEERCTIKKGTEGTVLGTKIKETGEFCILKSLVYRDKEKKYKTHIIAHKVKTLEKQLPIISNNNNKFKKVAFLDENCFDNFPDDSIFQPVDEEDIIFL